MARTHPRRNRLLVLASAALVALGAGACFEPTIEWSWSGTPGDPFPSFLNVMSTPSIIDLDGDLVPEVVFGATNSTGGGLIEVGVIRVLNGEDGSEAFTIGDPTLRVNTATSVATGDIDSDGRPEIIAGDSSGTRLIAFEHDGSFKWRSPPLERIDWGAPSIANLDGVGDPEIVIGRQVLDSSGAILWTGTGGRGTAGAGPLSLVSDIDNDGSLEVVAGNTVYDASGAIVWQAPLGDGTAAVANFDADSAAEVVLVTAGSVFLLDDDGSVIWGPSPIPGGGIGGPPTIADYDADGAPEIGVAGAVRYAVFETDGSLKWQQVTQDGSSNRTGSSVFDFEGDGAAEVVYSDEIRLFVFRGTDGEILFQTPLSSCTWHEYPLVADVDGDDRAEIVAVANNNCGFGQDRGVFVYGDPTDQWVPTRRVWNQHTYHITNVSVDGAIPTAEEPNWEVPGLNNFRLNEFGVFEGPRCDIDVDRVVDEDDIAAIFAARGQSAVPGDARDFDADGTITVNDARACALECSVPGCAPPAP